MTMKTPQMQMIDERIQRLLATSFHEMPGLPHQVIPGLGDIRGETGLLRELHELAMDTAEEAHRLSTRYQFEDLPRWWVAFTLEHFVAMHVTYQPGKAILCRSAASLALKIGMPDVVKMLVARGLEGDCPGDLAQELREVLTEARTMWPERFVESGGA